MQRHTHKRARTLARTSERAKLQSLTNPFVIVVSEDVIV